MEFIVSRSKWNGFSYWSYGCGCAIGQTLKQQGYPVRRNMYNRAILKWALTRGILWLTPQLVADLSTSIDYPKLDTDAQNWLRKTLARHGHTLTVQP